MILDRESLTTTQRTHTIFFSTIKQPLISTRNSYPIQQSQNGNCLKYYIYLSFIKLEYLSYNTIITFTNPSIIALKQIFNNIE